MSVEVLKAKDVILQRRASSRVPAREEAPLRNAWAGINRLGRVYSEDLCLDSATAFFVDDRLQVPPANRAPPSRTADYVWYHETLEGLHVICAA
jgi:hypothetical protein